MRLSPTATILIVCAPGSAQVWAKTMRRACSDAEAVPTVPISSPAGYTRACPRLVDFGVIHATLRPVKSSVTLAPARSVYSWVPANATEDTPADQPVEYCRDELVSWNTPTLQAGPA